MLPFIRSLLFEGLRRDESLEVTVEFRDDDPNNLLVYAYLRVSHRTQIFDPEFISTTLQIAPSKSFSYGDVFRGLVQRHSHWSRFSNDDIYSRDMCRHIFELLDLLKGKELVIEYLQAEGYALDIVGQLESRTSNGAIVLPPELIKQMAALKTDLSFDLYYRGNGDPFGLL